MKSSPDIAQMLNSNYKKSTLGAVQISVQVFL